MIGKIISWNVRGINDAGKRKILRGCLGRWNPIIVYLQETKMEILSDFTVKSLWKADGVEWKFLPSKGFAGGILLMWKRDWVTCMDVKIGEITISCLFSNNNNTTTWFFSGVYCRGNDTERTLLWQELNQCFNCWGRNGIIGGDFNTVIRRSERSGTQFNATLANEFLVNMENLDLGDLPLKGSNWTWSDQRDPPTFSRIDRFLVSADLLLILPGF